MKSEANLLTAAAIAAVRSRSARGPNVRAKVRVALHFHPDFDLVGKPILLKMIADGEYLSQFVTGTSNGGLTAQGGDRWRWEHEIFGGRSTSQLDRQQSQVISLFIVGLVQMLVFALPVILGYLFFRSSLNLPNFDISHMTLSPGPMVIGFLLLVGGFTLFTGTLVAVGAIMPAAKAAGNIFGIMMALIFIPFYVVTLVVSDPTAPIVQLFTYFP
jgi:hypothetical protein